MAKVSVIIPNYNHARFLPARMRSVLDQTFTDIEVIVLDDASTDESLAVLQPFLADPRVRLEVNASNSGSPFVQWNKGVSLASGQYVWIAESDDWAAPTFLERLVPLLDEHPRVGLAYCRSVQVDEAGTAHDGLERYLANFDPQHWDSDAILAGQVECRRFLFVGNTIPNASAALFRRDLYLRVGGADEDQRLTGDWRLWAKMLWEADVAYVADPLNHFRAHAGNVRTDADRSGAWVLESYRCVQYFGERFNAPPDVRRRGLDMISRQWAHKLLHERRPSVRVSLELMPQVRLIDPAAPLRLGRDLVKAILRPITRRLVRLGGPRNPRQEQV